MGLMSRPGLVVQEVATWERCHDLAWGRLPGRVATSARPACARPAHAERETCAGCGRDQLAVRPAAPTTWALRAQCARPWFWVCALCTQPSFVTMHCLGSLFMDIVQEHCSQGKKKKSIKILKIFLEVI